MDRIVSSMPAELKGESLSNALFIVAIGTIRLLEIAATQETINSTTWEVLDTNEY